MLVRARLARLAVVIALAGVSSACLVTSLQPIYDDASLEVDETLAGTWRAPEQGATVVVERGEWKSYRITYTDRSASYVLVGHLSRLGDVLYLDVTPARGLEAGPLMVPVHGICRVRHDGDTVSIAALDYDWFAQAIKAEKIAPLDAAFDSRQNVLVTSPTAALRAWLSKTQQAGRVFREPMSFARGR